MDDSRQEDFRRILDSFDTAMLVTHAGGGVMHARPMSLAKGASDGDLWFATSLDSGKIDDIMADPRVLTTFQSGGRYLALSGTAGIVRDHEKVRTLWTETWRPWFPEGEHDADLTLIHVRAEEAEYWEDGRGRPLRFGFEDSRAVRLPDPEPPAPHGEAPGRAHL